MAHPRDMQRAKLYRAENVVRSMLKQPELSLEECGAFVNKVLVSDTFKQLTDLTWHGTGVTIKDGRGTSTAYSRGVGELNLPRWARNHVVILHELAHTAGTRSTEKRRMAAHGWQFAADFLTLVRKFMGRQVYVALRDAFILHRVRYKAPRQFTPETLAAMRERGRALAAKRRPTP